MGAAGRLPGDQRQVRAPCSTPPAFASPHPGLEGQARGPLLCCCVALGRSQALSEPVFIGHWGWQPALTVTAVEGSAGQGHGGPGGRASASHPSGPCAPQLPLTSLSCSSVSEFESSSFSFSLVSSPSLSVWSSRAASRAAARLCSQGTRTSLCRRTTCEAADAPHWARLLCGHQAGGPLAS